MRTIVLNPNPDGSYPSFKVKRGEPLQVVLVPPPNIQVRVTGFLFASGKSFILPTAMGRIRELVHAYDEYSTFTMLIVGHADAQGDTAVNDQLALERARNVAAYLSDDVDTWLAMYQPNVPRARRWGSSENAHMLEAVGFGGDTRGFQHSRGLEVDGVVGSDTRAELVRAYMALDGTSLPPGTRTTIHGCGEHFPVVPTPDGTSHAANRRVDLFLFPKIIIPAPPGEMSKPGSTSYPTWCKQAQRVIDISGAKEGELGSYLICTDVSTQELEEDGDFDVVFRLSSSADRAWSISLRQEGETFHGHLHARFSDLPRDATFSLDAEDTNGSTTRLFENVPYDELSELSHRLEADVIEPTN